MTTHPSVRLRAPMMSRSAATSGEVVGALCDGLAPREPEGELTEIAVHEVATNTRLNSTLALTASRHSDAG